jgi:glycosyltransferase involved in cell wall biosynthesis/SAM-dependent methyltransferase
MIVRNEAANLPASLSSIADLVDELVVVDTGSTDQTKEVAAQFGARVYDFAWVDSFAAARNESIRHATGDWIFWLDGDEHLDEDNRKKLRTLFDLLQDENAGYVMKQRSTTSPGAADASVFEHVRLFRNRPDLRWLYRVHEQILPALERSGYVQRFTDIVVDHDGYEEPALYRRKQERNLRLLQLEDTEHPNDSLTQFNLGLTCQVLGRTSEALAYWRRSLELSQPSFSWVRKLYALLAGGYRDLGQRDDALVLCRTGLARYSDDTELLFLEASLLAAAGDLAGAADRLRQLLESPAPTYFAAGVDAGLRGYKARHNLALVYRAGRRPAEAEAQWRAVLAEQPAYVPAALALGELSVAQGRTEDLDQILQHLDTLPQGLAAAAQLRAAQHNARQEFAAARQVLEDALTRVPRTPELLLLFCRVLLREGRDWAAAERALRELLALDPYHPEARNNLMVLLQQQGRPADPLPPDVAAELFRRAERSFQAGHHADAAVLYRPLLHAGVRPGVVLYRLAMIANSQGDYAAAWDMHRRALLTDPALAAQITPADCPHHHIVCHRPFDEEAVPRCPVCGSTEQNPMMVVNCLPFTHYHPSINPVRRWVRCSTCGHGFANPRPSPAALREAYRDPPPAHLLAWNYERLTLWSDIVHDLWRHRPTGDFLDVGVANGALAGVAQDFGYRVCGLDVHPAYADAVRRLGVEFVLGDICTHDFGCRRFDVVALGDVIEHVAEPRTALARVAALLKADGLVWLSTPNYEGVWTRALRERDAMWLEGEHLQYFCLRSLRRLADEVGLEVVDYRLSKRFVGCAEVILRPRASSPPP